jgi:hypothetical protein
MESDRVGQWLQDVRLLTEERYQLVLALRKMILALDKSVTEEIKYGGILFGATDHFCGIFSYKHHVTLEFGEGANLSDPHQVLEGQGKFRRHIKLLNEADVKAKHVSKYLAFAWKTAQAKS